MDKWKLGQLNIDDESTIHILIQGQSWHTLHFHLLSQDRLISRPA